MITNYKFIVQDANRTKQTWNWFSYPTLSSHHTQVNINTTQSTAHQLENRVSAACGLQQDVCTYRLHTTHPGSPHNAQATILVQRYNWFLFGYCCHNLMISCTTHSVISQVMCCNHSNQLCWLMCFLFLLYCFQSNTTNLNMRMFTGCFVLHSSGCSSCLTQAVVVPISTVLTVERIPTMSWPCVLRKWGWLTM